MSDTTNPGSADGGFPSPAPAAPAAPAAAPAYAEPSAPGAIDELAGAGIAEDRDFSEHYRLLFASLALFVAALCMPIEGRHLDLYAKDSISGGFLTVFAGYGVLAAWMNIHSRKMIVWPVFFAAADGLYLCTMRGMQLVKQVEKPEDMGFQEWVRVFGSGFYVISLMSLYVVWTLFTAVMTGAKKDAARKAEAKAARAKK